MSDDKPLCLLFSAVAHWWTKQPDFNPDPSVGVIETKRGEYTIKLNRSKVKVDDLDPFHMSIVGPYIADIAIMSPYGGAAGGDFEARLEAEFATEIEEIKQVA